ncbi:MAG: hypothetical protein U0U46_08905 [Saprospiraceae bacterium]
MEHYQLSPAELEELKKWYDLEEIEQAERRVYTYEDWLDPNRKIGPFAFGYPGITSFYLTPEGNSVNKGEGVLTLFILPEIEGQKIEKRKAEIVEGFLEAYTNALISYFESRFNNSLEKKILVENEMERVRKLLFEWNERAIYATYGDDLWLRFQNFGNQKAGTICDWYERICINGEDAKKAVSLFHSTITASELSRNSDALHFAVAALAFERFKKYLNQKLETVASQERLAPAKVKPKIKSSYCCPHTLQIMQGLVEKFDVSQDEVRIFEEFFSMHPYTNLDMGNAYRDSNTRILDFDKLLDKIFEIASLFEGEIQEYFFACVIEDAEEKSRHRWDTDLHILKKKIGERREREKAAAQTPSLKDLRPLASYFHSSDQLDLAIKAATETGLIQDGVWVHIGYKTNAVSIFWRAAITAGLAKADAPLNKVVGAIKAQFRLESLGVNAIDKKKGVNDFDKQYKELYKSLLAVMRP